MIAKSTRSGPDAVAVDLEDAVAPEDKDDARRAAVAALCALLEAGPGLTLLIRVNPPGTPWFADDMAAVADAASGGLAGVVVPKVQDREQLDEVRAALGRHGHPDALVIAGIETALGVADCRQLITGELAGAYFGAEDFIADMGGRRTAGSTEVLYARSQVSLAARLAGVAALDQVVVDVRDDDRFRADAEAGRALGYQGKMCLHPRQVELAHEVFTPSSAEVAYARRVLDAGSAGVGVVDGAMVDAVHLRMAASLLRRAGL